MGDLGFKFVMSWYVWLYCDSMRRLFVNVSIKIVLYFFLNLKSFLINCVGFFLFFKLFMIDLLIFLRWLNIMFGIFLRLFIVENSEYMRRKFSIWFVRSMCIMLFVVLCNSDCDIFFNNWLCVCLSKRFVVWGVM